MPVAQYLAAYPVDVAGAERDQHIVPSQGLAQHQDCLIDPASIVRILMAHDGHQIPAVHAQVIRLPRCIDVTDEDAVGVSKGQSKLAHEVTQTAIGMWLVHSNNAPPDIAAAGRSQRRRDLCWVMGVVVNDDDAVLLTLDLEAPRRTVKRSQSVSCATQPGQRRAG